MLQHKVQPAGSFKALAERVTKLLTPRPAKSAARLRGQQQMQLCLEDTGDLDDKSCKVFVNIADFLDLLCSALPMGNVYLFGGVLRDLALFGTRGFCSDIDLVVDEGWDTCVPFLEHLGARKNKFGGYRLWVAGWPVDIWSAEETWA